MGEEEPTVKNIITALEAVITKPVKELLENGEMEAAKAREMETAKTREKVERRTSKREVVIVEDDHEGNEDSVIDSSEIVQLRRHEVGAVKYKVLEPIEVNLKELQHNLDNLDSL